MKILHIIPTLHGGGAEKFCIDLCNELSKKHEITICSLYPITEEMFMTKALDPKIQIITLNKKLGFDLTLLYKIYKLIKNNQYDIVNTHLRALTYSAFASIFKKTKTFHTVHNMATKETGKINRIYYSVLFRYFGVIPIGISHEVSRSIQSEYGNQFKVLIENGVKLPIKTIKMNDVELEIARYKKTSNTSVFLTIGRIAPQKNQRMLIEIFNRLINEGEDITLLIIGDDPKPNKQLLNELIQIANKDIHFLGLKENIADYLISSDAFCLSSLYEGLPITLLESIALGIIPICTPVGGVIDVIQNKENGLLSLDVSTDSYYNTIKEFLYLSPDNRKALSKNATENFKNLYNIAITAQQYIYQYDNHPYFSHKNS